VKVDLHIHTSVASACSMLSLDTLFAAARSRGLDGFCVTDHERYDGYRAAKRLGADLDVPVFMGIEIRTAEGDMLVYSEHELDFDPLGRRPPAQVVVDFAVEQGAFCVAAHPYRTSAPSLGRVAEGLVGLSAVEVRNGNCPDDVNEMAACLAERLGVPGTAGSDAHCGMSVGAYYTEFDGAVITQADFVRALFEGRMQPAGTGEPLEGY